MTLKHLKYLFYKLPIIIRLLILILIVMTVYGSFIHMIEPEQFPSILDGIWWAFVTGATVGYGDFVPESILGRSSAILLILTGGGLIAFYISSIAAETVQREQDLKKGKIKFKGTNHYVFIGWNERTKQLIRRTAEMHPDRQIVLIDRTITKIFTLGTPIHFIHGDPAEDQTLEMANIHTAERVMITADGTKNARQADRDTIITTIAIRGNNETVPIVAEVLSELQIENAIRAGATTIIRSNDFMSSLFYHELFRYQDATPFEDILRILNHEQFAHIDLPDECNGETFAQVALFMMEKGYLLLGILRKQQDYIHPPPTFEVVTGDVLITLLPWKR